MGIRRHSCGNPAQGFLSTVFILILVMYSGERKGKASVSLNASGFGLLRAENQNTQISHTAYVS